MQLSLRWAERSQARLRRAAGQGAVRHRAGRRRSRRCASRAPRALAAMDFTATRSAAWRSASRRTSCSAMLDVDLPHLPTDRPRYLMGVGTPDDIVEAVARGIDMFDCVMPTRAGRHGLAYTRAASVNLRNARHADDRARSTRKRLPRRRDYSRAYLHHLVKSGEMLGAMLLTWNNLAYYQELMAGMRAAIAAGRLSDFRDKVRAGWANERPAD